ncbi:hypothetical protein K501DRAFT_239372 [Backusella circina FSU 941]|nr:hypothetical protein K501DRAFT_239372 [Backusella circina FSU 941]
MSVCDVSIHLLPEFGWSMSNQLVYGPGSVFEGSFVKLNLTQSVQIERIRLAFHASEAIPYFEVGPGLIRATKKAIFGVQSYLWECKNQCTLFDQPEYNYPFIIQIPLIQFPPSFKHEVYVVQYQLIAIVDMRDRGRIQTSIPLRYMPFIETNLLKSPALITEKRNDLEANLRLIANKFLPGDKVNIHLSVNNISKRKGPHFITVNIKMKQVLHISAFDDIPDSTTVVASTSTKLLLIETEQAHHYKSEATLSLPLSDEMTPTLDYGNLSSISYYLDVNIEKGGKLGGILNYKLQLKDIPITIGTLGNGIRSSDEINIYSDVENSTELAPKFLKAAEYEDALPVYESSRLPSYEFVLEST